MRISYHTTSSFIRHTGNLVDLGEYRRKLALSQSDSLARQPQPRRCLPPQGPPQPGPSQSGGALRLGSGHGRQCGGDRDDPGLPSVDGPVASPIYCVPW